MTDHLTQRAQRLIQEFEEGQDVRHGLACVLQHLAIDYCTYGDGETESFIGVPEATLDVLVEELTAPTLLDRALAGDKAASLQVLQEMGVLDANGQLTERYRSDD